MIMRCNSLALSFLLILLCEVNYITSTIQDDRNPGLLFNNHPGYLLSLPANMTNITQTTTKVSEKMDCVFACTGTCWCRSVNFKIAPEMDHHHICELMATDDYTNGKYIKQDEKFTHLSIKNPCAEKPCLQNGKCVADKTRLKYRCKCGKGYEGQNCENALRRNCLEIYNSGERHDGVYTVSGSNGTSAFQVYCDMTTDGGGWTLIARFSNSDTKNWMRDDGLWWYDVMTAQGNITSTSVNQDMISPAFWSVSGSEIKITRSDDSSHTALLRTTSNCLRSRTFRMMITSYGNFRNRVVWASNKCLGSCDVVYGGQYLSTDGFSQAKCNGSIQSSNKIGFWCDYGSGDGSVMMIGGGGSTCARADHGIGHTEEDAAKFGTRMGCAFGADEATKGKCQSQPYGLNLWIR